MNPDHSTSKGYPYDIIISKDRFPNRLDPILDRNKGDRIQININPEVYPNVKRTWYHRLFAGTIIDFLMFRIFDYAEALLVAEQQIEDLLTDGPFLPEDFGFLKTVGPKEITDNPVKIYSSEYDSNISIFRNLEEECEWILLKRKDDGSFEQMKLQIPNHRIAYAAFIALGIKVEEINNNQNIEIMAKEKNAKKKITQALDFKAVYNNPQAHREAVIVLKAEDKDDAIAKAKFIFETAPELHLPNPCEWHHITITEATEQDIKDAQTLPPVSKEENKGNPPPVTKIGGEELEIKEID